MSAETEAFKIALFATLGKGKRAKEHRVVLYIGIDKDWSTKQLQRNGNTGLPLAVAGSTEQCAAYRAASHRARCLRYSGIGKADIVGLADDLRTLGYDEATVARFVRGARPYLPEGEGR